MQGEIDEESGWNTDLDFRFDKRFNVPGQQFTLDARYSFNSESESENNLLTDYLLAGMPLSNAPFERDNLELTDGRVFTAQADYVHPHMVQSGDKQVESWRIETGLQIISRQVQTDYRSQIRDTLSGELVIDNLVSNIFRLNENIISGYGTFSKRWSKWGLQAGLRIEQALTDPQLLTTEQVFDNDYFSLFPSMYLTRDLGNKKELQLNYSRRINRPNGWALNPFNRSAFLPSPICNLSLVFLRELLR